MGLGIHCLLACLSTYLPGKLIYLLTAIGLPFGGSIAGHIYTQTVHRTTHSTQTIHRTT